MLPQLTYADVRFAIPMSHRAASTEASQRVLQEVAIGVIQDTQTAQTKRDVAM